MIRTSSSFLAVALMTLAAGCEQQPSATAPSANVGAPAAEKPGAAAAPATGTAYKIEPGGSKIEWTGAKITGKHDGSFDKFSGVVRVPDGDATKGSVSVEIDMASVKSDVEKLTGHLKSPDFFDVAKFPTAKFTSTAIKAGGDKGASHTITGNLELHGASKAVSFPATVRAAADKVEVDAEFTINRKDFGIVYPGMPDDLIKDDVQIKLTIRAPKG